MHESILGTKTSPVFSDQSSKEVLQKKKKKERKYAAKLLTSPENVTFNWVGIMQSGVTRGRGYHELII